MWGHLKLAYVMCKAPSPNFMLGLCAFAHAFFIFWIQALISDERIIEVGGMWLCSFCWMWLSFGSMDSNYSFMGFTWFIRVICTNSISMSSVCAPIVCVGLPSYSLWRAIGLTSSLCEFQIIFIFILIWQTYLYSHPYMYDTYELIQKKDLFISHRQTFTSKP